MQKVLDRLRAVADADKAYTAFDGLDEDMDGSVKFIIETAGIEAKIVKIWRSKMCYCKTAWRYSRLFCMF